MSRPSLFQVLVLFLTTFVLASHTPTLVYAQQTGKTELSDMELIERVAFLQRELEAAEVPKRDAAEKELIALGERVLDYLEPPTADTPSDAIDRTTRVRTTLEKLAVAAATEPTTVNLVGEHSINQALEIVKKQTKNDVALSEQIAEAVGETKIKLDLQDALFWDAVSEIMKQGQLEVGMYAGGPQQIRLLPTAAFEFELANPDIPNPDAAPAKPESIPRNNSSIFDLSVLGTSASRNLSNPSANYCNVKLLIRWEPRLTPISIDLPLSTVKAVDDFDKPIELSQDGVISGIVQPEIPQMEFTVPFALIDRRIETIKKLEATIDAVLPGRTETFRFKQIRELEPGYSQTKAGATLTFAGTMKNEDLFGLELKLSFDEGNNALESHQSWVYDNELYLLDDERNRYDVLAYEAIQQTESSVTIRYYFEKDPKELTLYYKTPAMIVQVPVRVMLTKIPLP